MVKVVVVCLGDKRFDEGREEIEKFWESRLSLRQKAADGWTSVSRRPYTPVRARARNKSNFPHKRTLTAQ